MTEKKRKVGRPREFDKLVRHHVSMSEEQLAYCIKKADHRKGISAYIRKLIDQDMEKHNA